MDRKTVLQKLERLKAAFAKGEIPILHNHEVNPGLPKDSRENYLYFMLTCSLNFQRSSPVTWKSALATWNDPETNFVFFPEKTVFRNVEVLRAALLKHKLALQPNKHIEIWTKITTTLNSYFDNDPRKLFEKGEFDAAKILSIMQKEMKANFPYLSGPKLSNYVLFILLHYSDLKLTNTRSISIIPDTHIIQTTVKLGMLDEKTATPEKVSRAWYELLDGTQLSPIDFHSMLWNWSRNHFHPSV